MRKKFYIVGGLVLAIVLIATFLYLRTRSGYNSSFFDGNDYINLDIAENESCLQCHQNTTGYSNYHNPEVIGCSSCHLGNVSSMDKIEAHKGMILIPGNLSDAAQTCGKCHSNELKKIQSSLMTTNSGLVAVDKFVFGEADTPNYHYHIEDIKNSPSDKHLRDLCANCHLGAEKKDFGAISQESRGGGCNACHLNYDEVAREDLTNYLNSGKEKLPTFHPATNISASNEHCFGCHSRSSRISTSYEGWQETLLDEVDVQGKSNYKTIEDKRVYKYIQEDVHHSKGMLCIDCHSSHEVMGDGKLYTHADQAIKLQCSDCHFKDKPNTIPYDSLDLESMIVFSLRAYTHNDKSILAVEKDGHPLVNTFVDSLGNAFLISKSDGSFHPLNPQSTICTRDRAHKNVSCEACHSSWVPRCIGCHIQFDEDETRAFDLLDRKYVKGQWKEYVAEFSSSRPAMGVREKNGNKTIQPAVPGMILTIDKESFKGKVGEDVSFHRLYAPISPHTTTGEVRECKSCHANPVALGYGKGTLVYDMKNTKGKWVFTPEYALNSHDNLPEDAWIPFLKEVDKGVVNSTRTDFRPFTVEEQKKMLLIGVCLQCHGDNSEVMKQTLELGLEPILKKITRSCILPAANFKRE